MDVKTVKFSKKQNKTKQKKKQKKQKKKKTNKDWSGSNSYLCIPKHDK